MEDDFNIFPNGRQTELFGMFIFFCRRYSVHCDSWAECAVRSEGDQLWIAPSGHHVPKVNTKDKKNSRP